VKNVVLEVEDLSKQYRLGQVGTGTLSHDLNRLWHRLLGKPDPYLKIGEENDRATLGSSKYVWALRDVNFTINEGDAVGIIGRNGAGKSTLLKLLSKITKPSTGLIKKKGRIASLLEVGTGFHHEMTGRENIYLNGAIMGMTRREITRKLDEIVDFSGVERYIDTPVKRYSSGMYVRLAFAVAAHLDSEILIVDEVLAVGDADFQKKCLGKMGDIRSGEGRTVLFVSHNMSSIRDLCNKGILLKNGRVGFQGEVNEVIKEYKKDSLQSMSYRRDMDTENKYENANISIIEFSVDSKNGETIDINSTICVKLKFFNNVPNINLDATFELRNSDELIIFHTVALISRDRNSKICEYNIEFEILGGILNAGNYYFKLFIGKDQIDPLLIVDNFISFEVLNVNVGVKTHIFPGVIRPNFDYKISSN